MKITGHASLFTARPLRSTKAKRLSVNCILPWVITIHEVGHQQLVQGVWQAEGQASGPPAAWQEGNHSQGSSLHMHTAAVVWLGPVGHAAAYVANSL